MTLEYPRNDIDLGLKVKGQGHKVNKYIFHNNDYYAYVSAHLWFNWQQQYGVGLYSMSTY